MKKYSIFKQVFDLREERFYFRSKEFVFEQISDVAQQVDQAFLFGESTNFASVRAPEVTDQNTVVKFTEMVNNNLGSTAFVNMKDRDMGVGENPQPVAFPAGFVNMDKGCFLQELLQIIVNGSGFLGKLMIKSDQRPRYHFQSAQVLQYLLRTVIGGLGLITNKSGFSSGIRSDKGLWNFIFAPAVNDAFAIRTPVITVNETCRGKFAILDIFLDMFRGVVARRNIFAVAPRTAVKVNINGLIGLFGFSAEPARMTSRSTKLFSGRNSFFAFIFSERILERIGKLGFELGVNIFKFFDPFLKLNELVIAKVHGEFKFVNPFAQIFSFGKYRFRSLAIEKNTEIFEGTIRTPDLFVTIIQFAMLHGASPDNLPTPEPDTNITKVTIKINSFLNVNKKFSRNHHKLTMEGV